MAQGSNWICPGPANHSSIIAGSRRRTLSLRGCCHLSGKLAKLRECGPRIKFGLARSGVKDVLQSESCETTVALPVLCPVADTSTLDQKIHDRPGDPFSCRFCEAKQDSESSEIVGSWDPRQRCAGLGPV